MRRTPISRVTAFLTLIGAVFGILIALVGLIWLWTAKENVVSQVDEVTLLFGRTLAATRQTMDVTGRSLDQASTDLDLIHQMIGDLAGTLEDSSSLIDSTGNLVGTDMVDFVNNTQTSLASVEKSAGLVDSFLRVISSVPLIGGRYRPDVPLQESIASVSASMDPLPDAFTKIQSDLRNVSASADTLHGELQSLGQQVEDIQTSVSAAQKVVVEYQQILTDTQDRYDKFQSRLSVWVNFFYIGITALLIWLLISQLGALMMGIDLLSRRVE